MIFARLKQTTTAPPECNDGNDHQQFNQREGAVPIMLYQQYVPIPFARL